MIMVLSILMVLMFVALVVCIDRACVATPPGGRPGRVLETVWAPLLVIIPNAAGTLRQMPGIDGDVLASVSSPVIAAGLVVPMLVMGIGRDRGCPWGADDRMPMAWPFIGVLLLVLAVADAVPVELGLVIFAIVTVLAWCQSIPRAGESYGGPGAVWLLAAGVCSVAALIVSFPLGRVAVGITICGQIALSWVVLRRRGQRAALQTAGWAAVLGVGLTTGLLGHSEVVATVIPVAWTPLIEPTWPLAVPGILLMLICGCIATQYQWPRRWQWSWGVGTMAASISVLAWLRVA